MLELILSYALRDIGNGLRAVVEPVFIQSFSPIYVVGLIMGFSRLLSILSPFFVPHIAKKLKPGKAAKLGAFLWGFSLILASYIRNPLAYFWFRLLLMFGSLLNFPILDSIVQEILKDSDRKGLLFGIIGAVSSIAGAIGSFTASALVTGFSHAEILRISGFLEILSAFFIPEISFRVEGALHLFSPTILRKRNVAKVFGMIFAKHFFWGARDLIYPIFLKSIGKEMLTGIIFGASGLLAFLVSPVGGLISDRIGPKTALSIALLGMGICGIAIAHFPALILPLSLIYVFFEALSGPPAGSIFAEELKSEERALMNATKTSIRTVAFSLSSILAGFLYQLLGFRAMGIFAVFHFIACLL